MPRIHPDTKANLTLGVLAAILGFTVSATVFIWDMRRDIQDFKDVAQTVKEDHEKVTVLWDRAGYRAAKETPHAPTP